MGDLLRRIEVGRPYAPTPPGGHWPDGGAFLEWRRGMMELVLSLPNPTAAEVQAARVGKVRVGVAARGGDVGQLALVYAVAGLADGDAPYSLDLVPEASRPDLSPLAPGARYLLVLVLVDAAAGGTVRAIRAVSLSHRVSESLRAAVAGERWESVAAEAVGV